MAPSVVVFFASQRRGETILTTGGIAGTVHHYNMVSSATFSKEDIIELAKRWLSWVKNIQFFFSSVGMSFDFEISNLHIQWFGLTTQS